jgi:hypothetical protein
MASPAAQASTINDFGMTLHGDSSPWLSLPANRHPFPILDLVAAIAGQSDSNIERTVSVLACGMPINRA